MATNRYLDILQQGFMRIGQRPRRRPRRVVPCLAYTEHGYSCAGVDGHAGDHSNVAAVTEEPKPPSPRIPEAPR